MAEFFTWSYLLAASLGAAFAIVEMRMLLRFLAFRKRAPAAIISRDSPRAEELAPRVTVQIPLFNERTVAERVIRAAAAQDYPKHRFEIQILDDSTDETTDIVRDLVEELRARGVEISHLRRNLRQGYKAGALANGLNHSRGEFVAILDADFCPEPSFLRRLLIEEDAFDDPKVAFLQARWAYENADANPFTAAQSLLLDRHFLVQKPIRQYLGNVTTFNGSAGIWRRSAIEAVGGWSSATITEDLDLSFRCALRGWRGHYTREIGVPSEIPEHMSAFKMQQRRWACGTAQCFRKLLWQILRARGAPGRSPRRALLGRGVYDPPDHARQCHLMALGCTLR